MKKFLFIFFLLALPKANLIFNHHEVKAESASYYFERATKKSEKGLRLEAIADFTTAIYLDPSLWQAFNNRGLDKMLIEDYSGAINDFSKTIEIKPDFANAYYFRGWSKDLLQDYQGAINDLNKAISLDDNKADYYYILGNAYYKSGFEEVACNSWINASRSNQKIDPDVNKNANTLIDQLCN